MRPRGELYGPKSIVIETLSTNAGEKTGSIYGRSIILLPRSWDALCILSSGLEHLGRIWYMSDGLVPTILDLLPVILSNYFTGLIPRIKVEEILLMIRNSPVAFKFPDR